MVEEPQTVIIPVPAQGAGGVPLPQRNDRADLLDRINPQGVVELTRHLLMGQEWDGSKWVDVEALKGRHLTVVGAWEIASQLHGIANLATSISRFKHEAIKGRLDRIAFSTQLQLVANWRAYGITNVSQFYFVHNIVFGISMAVLNQAGEGSIQDLLGTIKSESSNITQERREPGKLKRIMGLG